MLRELEESGNWAAVRFVLETRAQALEQTENPSTASYLQGLHSQIKQAEAHERVSGAGSLVVPDTP